jgi:hypothetical protein
MALIVESNHPRLFFISSDITGLKANWNSMSWEKNKITSYCNNYINSNISSYSGEYFYQDIRTYAFAWKMDGTASFLARVKTLADALALRTSLIGDESATMAMCIAFDWCFDSLTYAQKASYGGFIKSSISSYLTTNNFTTMNNYHSKIARLNSIAMAGLALYNSGVDDAYAVTLCNMLHDQLYNPKYTIAAIDEIAYDGGYFEGDYNVGSFYGPFLETMWLWDKATNEDPFDHTNGGLNNMRYATKYFLYELGPKNDAGDGLLGSKQGDSKSAGWSGAQSQLYRILLLLAKKYQDGTAKWLANQISTLFPGMGNSYDVWQNVLYTDTSLVATTPIGSVNYPSSACFSTIGTGYIRSGFDISQTSTDIYSVFRSERYCAGHSHAHQGHFMIARGNDLLAIDSGNYEGVGYGNYNNYSSRTVAHNCVTIYKPGETWSTGFTANDGGQRVPNEQQHATLAGDASTGLYLRGGGLTMHSDSTSILYETNDLTPAFHNGKVSYYKRFFWNIKPNIFVIVDVITSTNQTYQKKWLLHTINSIHTTPEANIFYTDNGTSRMFIKSMLYGRELIAPVGGPGNEFVTNGVNYPPTGTITPDMGVYRLELSASTDSLTTSFVNVLYVTTTNTGSMPSCEFLFFGDAIVGIIFNGSCYRPPTTINFGDIPTTTVPENLPTVGNEVKIYNIKGQLVFNKKMDNLTFASFVWDWHNNSGQKVASGVYFLKFGSVKKKIVVVW